MEKTLLKSLFVATALAMGTTATMAQGTEFSKQNYIVVNLGSEMCWGVGNSWGTQATLVSSAEYVTLVPQEDGTYFMESQVSNGGTKYYLGYDNGYFMDNGSPLALTITKASEEPLGFIDEEETKPIYAYYITNDGKYFGYDGSTTVVSGDVDITSEQGQQNASWLIVSVADAKEQLLLATEEDPADATFLIEDHNFGRNNRYSGNWKGTGLKKGGDNTNMNTESYVAKFDLYQTITGVPNGKYALKAQAAVTYHDNRTIKDYDGNGAPVIYANGETADFNEMVAADQLSTQGQMSTQFTAGEYWTEPVVFTVSDGTITLGAKCERTDIWAVWDNFVLTYLGPIDNDEIIELRDQQVKGLLETANSLKGTTETISDGALQKLAQAIAGVDYEKSELADDALFNKFVSTLTGAIEYAQASIATNKLLEQGGVVPNDKLDNWTCTNDGQFHVNTWSVEGNEGNDPSGMTTPFIENWIGKPGPLTDGIITYTLKGIANPGKYKGSALIRIYSESGEQPTGAMFFVGNNTVAIASSGENFEYNNMKGIYGTFEAEGNVGDDETLTVGVRISGATFNWVAIKNLTITSAVTDGIENVKNTEQKSDAIYNLQGQRVNNAHSGLFIKNGKKVVIK